MVQCAVIMFLNVKKIPPINIHYQMQPVYGDKYPDVSRHWVWQVKQEVWEASLGDDARSQRPVTAKEESHQECFEEMI